MVKILLSGLVWLICCFSTPLFAQFESSERKMDLSIHLGSHIGPSLRLFFVPGTAATMKAAYWTKNEVISAQVGLQHSFSLNTYRSWQLSLGASMGMNHRLPNNKINLDSVGEVGSFGSMHLHIGLEYYMEGSPLSIGGYWEPAWTLDNPFAGDIGGVKLAYNMGRFRRSRRNRNKDLNGVYSEGVGFSLGPIVSARYKSFFTKRDAIEALVGYSIPNDAVTVALLYNSNLRLGKDAQQFLTFGGGLGADVEGFTTEDEREILMQIQGQIGYEYCPFNSIVSLFVDWQPQWNAGRGLRWDAASVGLRFIW